MRQLTQKLYHKALLLNNPFYFYGIPRVDYTIKGQIVVLRKLGISIDRKAGNALLQSYPYAVKISEAAGGKFHTSGSKLFLKVAGLVLQIHSFEDIFIAYEVFVLKSYEVLVAHDLVVIDVGMNTGTTTLFYAIKDNVKKIYSFELFAPTFEMGLLNFGYNEGFRNKIQALNFGISDRDFETELDYSVSNKGRMGLDGLPRGEQFDDIIRERVKVKDAAAQIESILSAHPVSFFLLKLDCEGEEFRIVQRLNETGVLTKITFAVVEWHSKTGFPTLLERLFGESGFCVFWQRYSNVDTGMLYATKVNGRVHSKV